MPSMGGMGAPRPGGAGVFAARAQYIAATLGPTQYTVPNTDSAGVFPWRVETLKSGITHSTATNPYLFTIVTPGLYYISAVFTVQAATPTQDLSVQAQLVTPAGDAVSQGLSDYRSRVGGNWSADDLVVSVSAHRLVQFAAGDTFRFALTGPTSTGGIIVNADSDLLGEGPSAWMQAFRIG